MPGGNGVAARHLPCRGQIHTSLSSAGVILSPNAARAEIGAALRDFFAAAPLAS